VASVDKDVRAVYESRTDSPAREHEGQEHDPLWIIPVGFLIRAFSLGMTK
jgi:hypothetical protein